MENKIESIVNWSNQNDIPLYKSEIEQEIKRIEWNKSDSGHDSLADFLDFLRKTKPKFIILSYNTFEYNVIEDSIKSTIKEIKESEEKETLDRFKKLANSLKTRNGKVYKIEVSFVENGFCFSYTDFAVWSDEYPELQEIINEFAGRESLIDRFTINKETLKLAKELAQFDLFKKATNKTQREIASSMFFQNRTIDRKTLYHISTIVDYADSIGKMGIESII